MDPVQGSQVVLTLPGEEVFNGKAGKAGLTILLGRALYDY